MDKETEQMIKQPDGMTEAMRSAFARMFADQDFRGLLIHLAQRANKGIIDTINSDIDKAKIHAARYQTYNRMYELGQYYFQHFDKIEKDRAKKKVDKEI